VLVQAGMTGRKKIIEQCKEILVSNSGAWLKQKEPSHVPHLQLLRENLQTLVQKLWGDCSLLVGDMHD
jgi:2'-5' RNA ligase